MARKLSIAASVFFGLLTVALCVLWVRSYWREDSWARSDDSFSRLISVSGCVVFHHNPRPLPDFPNEGRGKWMYSKKAVKEKVYTQWYWTEHGPTPPGQRRRLFPDQRPVSTYVSIPYWLPTIASALALFLLTAKQQIASWLRARLAS